MRDLKVAREDEQRLLKLAASGVQLTKHRNDEREKRAIEQANTFGRVAQQWVTAR